MSAEQTPLTETAITRLTNPDKSADTRDRAVRLGRAVRHQTDLANRDPRMRFGGGQRDRELLAGGSDYRISRYVSASVSFWVDTAFDDLQHTPDWLNRAKRAELVLRTHDFELPDDLRGADDWISEVTIRLTPAEEYEPGLDEPHIQPHAASYEDGSRLDALDTETVIGILALIGTNQNA